MEKGFDPHSGLIFTIPAFFLWAKEGVSKAPDIVSISVISLIGGFWGVFFMIPLRNALIVREHGTLPYPEETACADVLLAGEKGGEKARNFCKKNRITSLYYFFDICKFVSEI